MSNEAGRYRVRRGGYLRLRVGTKVAKLKLQQLNGVAEFELFGTLPEGLALEVTEPKYFARRRRHAAKINRPFTVR